MKMYKVLNIGLLSSLLLSSAHAQTQGSLSAVTRARGPFSVYAHFHSLESSTSTTDSGLLKLAGDQQSAPGEFPAPASGLPDYRLASMFPMLSSQQLDLVQIDGFSTGNDLLGIDVSGVIDPGAQGVWAALMFSVKKTARGRGGSWVRVRSAEFGGPGVGADIMSHVFAGSVGIDQQLWGRTFVEQAAGHIGHAAAAEIDAFDAFAPLIATNVNPPNNLIFFPNSNFVYLSLTNASATSINALPLSPAPFGDGPVTGASILRFEWTGGVWANHQVYRTPAQLGLEGEGDEVDAVGYDPARNAIVFSHMVRPGQSRPQLEVSFDGAPGTILTLSHGDGTEPLHSALGIRFDDDIDALCGIDPEASTISRYLGTPVVVGLPQSMSFSISRVRNGNPWDVAHMQVSGWGNAARMNSVVNFYAVLETDPGNSILLGSVARTADQQSVELTYGIPTVPEEGENFYVYASMIDPLSGGMTNSWVQKMRF